MNLLSDPLLFCAGRYEVYRRFWFTYEKLEGTATLELLPEKQHNGMDRLQKGSKKSTTLLFMAVTTLNLI